VSSHVLGLTDLDGRGISGIEYAYNHQLTGNIGKRIVVNDQKGREVEYVKHLQDMQLGENVVTSIDHRLQYLAHKELHNAIVKHSAKSGSVVILDVSTGEVLAMANQPTFNPNEKITNINSNKYRNIAVTDYFEPASSVKAFSIASVLERGLSTNVLVDTNPGTLQLRGGVVKDLKNHGVLTLATILQHSSNIGISKLILADPNINSANLLWNMYDRVGFGTTTSSGFPGESNGVLNLPNKNQQFVLATMSFGYGMAVTPLQLARAYAVLGARGIRRPVSFIKLNEVQPGIRVMNPKITEQIVEMLALTSSRNTYNLTKVEGYNIAGKTGTARKLINNNYDKNKHLAVFCGLAPVNEPKFSIVVTINEPSVSGYYGNQVAAPVFAKVASSALSILNIPPDATDVHVAQSGVNHS
jgi:cell division protein FtsI (penicillin-binding protein 3)